MESTFKVVLDYELFDPGFIGKGALVLAEPFGEDPRCTLLHEVHKTRQMSICWKGLGKSQPCEEETGYCWSYDRANGSAAKKTVDEKERWTFWLSTFWGAQILCAPCEIRCPRGVGDLNHANSMKMLSFLLHYMSYSIERNTRNADIFSSNNFNM